MYGVCFVVFLCLMFVLIELKQHNDKAIGKVELILGQRFEGKKKASDELQGARIIRRSSSGGQKYVDICRL